MDFSNKITVEEFLEDFLICISPSNISLMPLPERFYPNHQCLGAASINLLR